MHPELGWLRQARRRLGLLVVFLLLAGCGDLSVRPGPTFPPVSTAEGLNVATPDGPALIEARQIVLEWPARIREKDSDLILLSLVMDSEGKVTVTPETPGNEIEGTPVEIPNLYETHNLVAAARLDMAGLDSWREEMREPMRPGKPVVFRWSIRAEESGVFRGVVWLYLELIPKNGGQTERVVLLSRPIQVDAVTVIGLPGWAGRSLGGVGLVVSTVLGYPFVQPWLERFWKRRSKPAARKRNL